MDRAARNMLAGVFPLVTNAMFTNLGYPAASSLLGGVVWNPVSLCNLIDVPSTNVSKPKQGVLLTIVPWVLVFYGPQIRARSKFASVCFPSVSVVASQ